MPIKSKLILTFLLIAVISIVFITTLSFHYAKNSLEQSVLKGLHIVALAKKAEVMEYLNGKRGRTLDFASDGFIRDQAELIAATPDTFEKIRASQALNEHLKLNKKPLDQEILEIRILDLEGRIIGTSEKESLLGADTGKTQAYFLEGSHSSYIQDSGILMHEGEEKEVIAIGTPLKGRRNNTTIGVLVNFYNLATIEDVLLGIKSHQWDELNIISGEKNSRDIFLVNQQKLLVTPSKKITNFKPLAYKALTEPIQKGILFSEGINGSWRDIQKKEVLGASALLKIEKDWKWLLLIEQDKDEVLAPIYSLRNFSASAGIIVLLLVVVIALFTAKSIAEPIREVTLAAQKMSRGESWVKIAINSKDEVGALAQSFNRMVEKRQIIEDELRLAKTKIGEEKTKCEMVLASIGDGMIVVNQEGFIMMMNHEAETMFGWDIPELVGKNFMDAITCEDEKGGAIPLKERIMPLALLHNKTVHANAYYYRRDGLKFPASVTASPILFEGKVIGAIGIFRDITKEKEVDKMKSDFISTVSHEIRTPLTTIREGVSQAFDGILGEITQKQREVFTIVLDDADRLKRIIDNLLDVSKIEAGKVELKRELIDVVSLAQGVASAFSLSAQEKGLEIRTHFSQSRIKAYVDKDKLIQVFTNLVGNSLKFTEKGFVEISVIEKDDGLKCSIVDTGRGIAQEDLPKLFSKFQQFGRVHGPGEKGTGLGLSICKGLIELHRGKIWSESELNKGTKVSFFIPKYTAEQLFREYVSVGIRKLAKEKNTLSLLIYNIKPLADFHQEQGFSLAEELTDLLRRKIRFDSDAIVESENLILLLLAGATKQEAEPVGERIHKVLEHYVAKKGFSQQIAIASKVVTYPEDGKADEELVEKMLDIKGVKV